ncbi:hypothetical protein FVE85_3111 [Porphyridium purpureum]|uniref:BTB domain-containing protein n=1 Tax=Porphyridium purpureum TaxID=35688 RepID=A0A5J4YVC3_PORPP|nr:hypothetical protein FVE85_3111 [Porphyridium purpureum]|eukprot:POR4417..scf227_4
MASLRDWRVQSVTSRSGIVATVSASALWSSDAQRNAGRAIPPDVELVVFSHAGQDAKPTVIRAHGVMLKLRSPYLKRLIEAEQQAHEAEMTGEGASRPGTMASMSRVVVPFSTAPKELWDEILRFVYTGRVSMRDECVMAMYVSAGHLGIASLQLTALKHMKNLLLSGGALSVWAMQRSKMVANHRELQNMLSGFILDHTEFAIMQHDFLHLSVREMERFLLHDSLSCPEDRIWQRVVEWASVISGVAESCELPIGPRAVLDELGAEGQDAVRSYLAPLLQPGFLRILNISPGTFARQTEPLGVASIKECALKYKVDTISLLVLQAKLDLSRARQLRYSGPQWEFEARLRRLRLVFESEHPHARGVQTSQSKRRIDVPSWWNETRVTFDVRCRLGKYSDLCFYRDEECTDKVFSLYNALNAQRVGDLATDPIWAFFRSKRRDNEFSNNPHAMALELKRVLSDKNRQLQQQQQQQQQQERQSQSSSQLPLHSVSTHSTRDQLGSATAIKSFVIQARSFYYTWYSPANFEAEWGYRFVCTPEV